MTPDKEWNPATVFDVLGCPTARRILAMGAIQPCSAEELTANCDSSKPTVYRRLNVLAEYELLVEHRAIDDDGTHYKTYETALDEVRLSIEPGRFAIDVELDRAVASDVSDDLADHSLTSEVDVT